MKKLQVVFSHGKESGPMGSKIKALAAVAQRLGATTISVNYREHPEGVSHDQNAPGEAQRRVEQLLSLNLEKHTKLVLVGSSMGGYVSSVASLEIKPDGLFLLAPAFYIPGYENQNPKPHAGKTMIVHGWRDDVVPVAGSTKFAQTHQCDIYLLDVDHRLNDVLPKIEPLFEVFLKQVIEGKSA
jgi:alpha/beta superfamily hydrolase